MNPIRIIVATILGLIISNPGIAIPDWVVHQTGSDSTYRYYVGRSSSAANQVAAFNAATQDAIYQSIRDNFGFHSQISQETYQTEDRISLSQRVKEASRNIHFDAFEQVDSYLEKASGDRWNAWVMFRYRKEAIEKEKQRLRSVKEHDETHTVEPSVIGTPTDFAKGSLVISSDPEGAVITIDGATWGESPLKIIGKLAPGKHTIRLEHPKYEVLQEEINFSIGSSSVFKRSLMKASGKVRVVTDLPGSSIFVDGQYLGATPTEFITFEAGDHVIKATHAEAEIYTQTFTLAAGDQKTLTLALPLKPSSLSVTVIPSGAKVIVDGKEVVANSGRIPLSAGKHTLVVTRDKYLDQEIPFQLRGGENLVLPPTELVALSDAILSAERINDSPYVLSAGVGLAVFNMNLPVQDQYGLSLSVKAEKQFKRRIGLRIGISASEIPEASESSPSSHSQMKNLDLYSVEFGIPIYIGLCSILPRCDAYLAPVLATTFGSYEVLNASNELIPDRTGSFQSLAYGIELGWLYLQDGPFSFKLSSSYLKPTKAIAVNNVHNVFMLDFGWVPEGVSGSGIKQMKEELRR